MISTPLIASAGLIATVSATTPALGRRLSACAVGIAIAAISPNAGTTTATRLTVMPWESTRVSATPQPNLGAGQAGGATIATASSAGAAAGATRIHMTGDPTTAAPSSAQAACSTS